MDECENVRLRMVNSVAMPDALYMVRDQLQRDCFDLHPRNSRSAIEHLRAAFDVEAASGVVPVPSQQVVEALIKREAELLCSAPVQRALALPATNKRAVTYLLQVRVVRESGLPDSCVEMLHNSKQYSQQQDSQSSAYLRHASRTFEDAR